MASAQSIDLQKPDREITHLRMVLAVQQHEYSALLGAARAAVAAAARGDPNPLFWITDELQQHGHLPATDANPAHIAATTEPGVPMTPRPSDPPADRYAESTTDHARPVYAAAERLHPRRWQRVNDTTDTTVRTGPRGEPDVIVWGRDDDATSAGTGDRSHVAPRSPALRQLRRFAEPALLVAAIAAAIMTLHVADSRRQPERVGPPSAGTAAAARVPQVHPRLIAPAIAAPGQRIVVLAFKDAGLCGYAELRFDDNPVEHQLTAIAGSQLPDRVEMFMGLQIPRSATAGRHTLDLYGPPAASSTASICTHPGRHQPKLATTTIAVAGRAA